MLNFGTRKIANQGGSCLISLPMPWIRGLGVDIDAVDVVMQSDNSLRITAIVMQSDNPLRIDEIVDSKTEQEPKPESVQNNTPVQRSTT